MPENVIQPEPQHRGPSIWMVTHDQRYGAHADRSMHLSASKVVHSTGAV